MRAALLFFSSLLALPAAAEQPTPIPAPVQAILAKNCLECHDADTEKGDVNLELDHIDWTNVHDIDLWLRAFDAIDQGLMPPPKKERPATAEKEAVLAFLDANLLKHIPIGGTLPRRLNQAEFEQTIRSLCHLPKFELPVGFPGDTELHGFDNLGEGLVLSPSHLDAYTQVAAGIADEIFPPEKSAPTPKQWTAGPDDLVLSFSAATVHGDALRLVSRSPDIMRSCTWPSKIEIQDSGTYRISVEASKFLSEKGHTFEGPMKLEVRARAVTATDRSRIDAFRLLKEIEVNAESPETTTFEADLYSGETLIFWWANAEMTHSRTELAAHYKQWFEKDPRFLAAWQKAVFPKFPADDIRSPRTTVLRGRNGWDKVSTYWADPQLDLRHATMESKMTGAFLKLADGNDGTFNLADALCHFYHERGPALELHYLTIEGPSKLVPSPADLTRAALREKITGPRQEGQSNEDFARSMLQSFLPRAFRRPVDDQTVETYLTLAKRHWDAGHTLDEGLHLLLRNVLISPRFLYRCLQPGKMDDFDLATRLSYFLTQGPPDDKLTDLAQRNRLNPDWVLRREAERLLPTKISDPMIQSFVGQWLDTATLQGIMPDPKFNFDESSTAMAKQETERFVLEMLLQNLPMTDFIDPDFTFSSVSFVQRNYGFTPAFAQKLGDKLDRKERVQFRKIKIDRNHRHGGLLGQTAIMMATANGVDTQPVIRGVWMLENILGMPPPPPPKNVPALTPDTNGSTTPRELLAAHTQAAACAGCHRRIDPIGFVLENYDPVGRWRQEWPGTATAIDPSGLLPDGTPIQDIHGFKAWLLENIDLFSECVAEKLMTYATGRVPNFAERREIETIVKENHQNGNRFRDLVLALIDSQTFRTR